MKTAFLLGLVVAVCGPAFADDYWSSRQQLMQAAGTDSVPYVAPVQGQAYYYPVAQTYYQRSWRVCPMSISYREMLTGLGLYIKQIDGFAIVACPGSAPVNLEFHGGGPAIGIGIPNYSPLQTVAYHQATNLTARVPYPGLAAQFNGTYGVFPLQISVPGYYSVTWRNYNGVEISIPGNLLPSFNANITTLQFRVR